MSRFLVLVECADEASAVKVFSEMSRAGHKVGIEPLGKVEA